MVVGVLFLFVPLIFMTLPVVSLATAGALIARAPFGGMARIALAVVVVALGFVPSVLLVLTFMNFPGGE
jgi:hypothetical protein